LANVRKTGVPTEEALILNNLGRVAFYKNDYPKALEFFQQSLVLSQTSVDRRGQASIFSNLGKTYFALGEQAKGFELLNQALSLSQSRGEKLNEAFFLQQLGKTYFTSGEFKQAEEFLLKSLDIYRQIEDPTNLAETLFSLAKTAKKLGKFEQSQKYYEEALKLIETFRSRLNSNELRESFASTLYDNYNSYTELMMERHAQEPEKGFDKLAWLASERGRARNLLNLLSEANADIYEGIDKDLLNKEREIYNLLNARLENLSKTLSGKHNPKQVETLREEVEKIRADYQIVQSRIREKSPRYAALTQPEPITIEEVQNQLLEANTALLSYSLGTEKSFLWFVTNEKAQVFELPKREIIEAKARQNYQLLTARNQKIKFETADEKQTRIARADAESKIVSDELSRILLAPVENLLENKRLLLVVDGGLQYLPFAGLKRQNRYLIETNEIVNLPSATALSILRRENKNRQSAPKTIAVLADPVFDVRDERYTFAKIKSAVPNTVATRNIDLERSIEDLGNEDLNISRLPFTRKEAESISKFVPKEQRKIALDFAATRKLALSDEMNQYRIIHFATHGILNNKNPELSGLVFSLIDENGNPLNGFLRTDEVFNLKLSADLVVLSGCKTGLGREVRGEGLIGLTRGFMYAGASRAMVSLWDVNDEATAELMSQFYQNYLGKKMKPAQALREAQLAFLKDKRFANPYYAMAFTIHGEF
jgi:CHAT domain-containing protein